MSKHRFPHFKGEETKLCKTYLSVQGLVRGKNGGSEPAGLSHPCVVAGRGRWQFKVSKERERYSVV